MAYRISSKLVQTIALTATAYKSVLPDAKSSSITKFNIASQIYSQLSSEEISCNASNEDRKGVPGILTLDPPYTLKNDKRYKGLHLHSLHHLVSDSVQVYNTLSPLILLSQLYTTCPVNKLFSRYCHSFLKEETCNPLIDTLVVAAFFCFLLVEERSRHFVHSPIDSRHKNKIRFFSIQDTLH